MIISGLLKMLADFLLAVAALLPTYQPPPAADLSAFSVIAWLVPVNEIVTLTFALAVFATASVTYVGINWCINKLRGSG